MHYYRGKKIQQSLIAKKFWLLVDSEESYVTIFFVFAFDYKAVEVILKPARHFEKHCQFQFENFEKGFFLAHLPTN